MSEIKMYGAAELNRDEWRQLQGLSRDAFAGSLDRSQTEIDVLVDWAEPDVFYESHVDPNSQVGKRYNANQSYSRPVVSVAIAGGEPIGFAFSAHNVSGVSSQDRLLKRLSIVKNYLWMREVAVRPEFQRQGIARKLAEKLLRDAMPLQPPTAYIWPDEISFLRGALGRLGFKPTGDQMVQLFGEHSTPVRQVRLQAPSAHSVLQRL